MTGEQILNLPLQTRAVSFEAINREQRLIHFSFSSNEPCRRQYGWEILSHEPGACDTTRISAGACPFLRDHNWSLQAGKVLSCQLTSTRNYGVAKLFSTPIGEELLTEISEGRTEISCAYIIKAMELTKSSVDHEDDTYTVNDYEILEISSVSVAADIHCGVGRLDNQVYACRVMSAPNIPPNAPMPNVQPLTELPDPDAHFSPWKTRSDLTVRMQHVIRDRYSLRDILLKGNEVDGIERDVHRYLSREKGLDAMGILVPFDVFTRDLSITGGAGAGGEMVETTLQTSILDVIRPHSAVISAGARVIDNLVGNFVYPRRATYTPAGWQTGENAQDALTGPTFQQLTLSPCRLTIETRISKQLLEQSADRSLDAFLKDSLLRDIGATLDAAALTGTGPGTGTSGQPLGLLAQAENIGTPPYDYSKLSPGIAFGSGPPTWTSVLQLGYNVTQHNAMDDGTLAYILSDPAKLVMSQTQIIPGSNFPKFIYANGKIGDYPAKPTSNLNVTNQVVFGRWSDYVFTLWALDVFSDPFTYASTNQIRIVINALVNCGTLRGISFARSEDSAAG